MVFLVYSIFMIGFCFHNSAYNRYSLENPGLEGTKFESLLKRTQ